MLRMLIAAVAISLLATPATANAEPRTPEPKRYSVGIGYAGTAIDVDFKRDGDDLLTLDGWGLRGCVGMKGPWALQVRYLSVDEDFRGGGQLLLDQLDLQANFKLLKSDRKYFHVYATLGLSRMDFEERAPLTGTFSDRAFGAAVGVGLEYGPPRYAFFADFGATFVDVRLSRGAVETWTIVNTVSGFAFRF